MIDLKKSSKPRMMLRFLHQTKVLSDDKFKQAMASNLTSTQPWQLVDSYIHLLGWILIAAGMICLTAFNWFQLTDFNKLAIAETALLLSFISILLTKKDLHRSIAGGIFAIVIGSFWAVFGQIYQINSSLYHFTLVWGICLLPFAIILRQQFVTIVTALLFYSTITLYLSSHSQWSLFDDSLTYVVISILFTVAMLLTKWLKIPSFQKSIGYIFFTLSIASLFTFSIELVLTKDSTKSWIILLSLLILGILLLAHCHEKAMMVILYLVTILIFFFRIISLPNMDIMSIMITTSLCAVLAIYPTYRGAIKLISYADKVNHHE